MDGEEIIEETEDKAEVDMELVQEDTEPIKYKRKPMRMYCV